MFVDKKYWTLFNPYYTVCLLITLIPSTLVIMSQKINFHKFIIPKKIHKSWLGFDGVS
jgi:hypothetical protein